MRTLAILWRLAPFALSFIRDWRRWIVGGGGVVRTPEFHRERARRLVGAVSVLGPTFIKVAQIFASRSDIIPEPYIGALGTLTDQVAPIPLAQIRAEIAAAYGTPVETTFERFDDAPIAAASLGQVHRARYRGQEVVVKVLRPGVEELVRRDIAAARPIVRWIERRWPNPHIRSAAAIIDEFAVRIWEEMDFRKEAANAEEIRANFAGNQRVAVPRVITELVTSRVLVLEFMEGDRIDALGAGSADPRGVISAVMELYIQMMLVDGLFHADPHPGNLLVAPDGTLVLLDFGMVVRVPREMRWSLVNTVFAAVRRDVDGVVAGFQSLGLIDRDADMTKIRELAVLVMGIAYERTTTPERIQLLAEEVLATLYDWPVTLPSEMVYFARTAALIEGLGVRYDPHFNPITFAAPIALRMRRRIVASLGEGRIPELDWATTVGGTLGAVAGLVTRVGREFMARLRDGRPMDGIVPIQGFLEMVAPHSVSPPRGSGPGSGRSLTRSGVVHSRSDDLSPAPGDGTVG